MKIPNTFILFTVFCMVIFALYPEIDLVTASYFYDEKQHFYLKEFPLFYILYKGIGPLLTVTFLLIGGYLYYQKRSGYKAQYLDKKAAGFLLIFLLVGPALVTNSIFKEFSGRASPKKLVEFSGTKEFTPYYVISDQCESNCAFFSGHASAAFFFMAFGYVLRSRNIFFLGITFGVLMSITRMAQGGHFLSDVIFAFIVNFIILKVLYYLFYKEGAVLEKSPK